MTDLGTTGTLLGALMVLANFVVQQVAVAAAFGALGPNAYIGVRNEATRYSREAWTAAHRAVLVLVGVGTVAGIGLSIAAITLAGDGRETAAIVLSLIAAALLAAVVVAAERKASRTATGIVDGETRR